LRARARAREKRDPAGSPNKFAARWINVPRIKDILCATFHKINFKKGGKEKEKRREKDPTFFFSPTCVNARIQRRWYSSFRTSAETMRKI